jgi:hypothetical protein
MVSKFLEQLRWEDSPDLALVGEELLQTEPWGLSTWVTGTKKELLGDSVVFLGVDGRSRSIGNVKRLGMGGGDGQGSPPALADQIGGVGVVVGHHSEDGKTN